MNKDKLAQALRAGLEAAQELLAIKREALGDDYTKTRGYWEAERELSAALAAHEAEKQAGPVAWVRWDGGACPIPWGTQVHVRHRTGREYGPCRAGESYAESWGHNGWSSDIVAYRLAAPPSESDKEDAELPQLPPSQCYVKVWIDGDESLEGANSAYYTAEQMQNYARAKKEQP